ncbi:ABC transporter substrate-binding protein [Flavobacterium sp.]|uniref:ABC transporter substrate-binding protein n=1 Tax=Flavobacterium sp. TaxID=239 RepID=UPI0037506D00
MNPSFLKIFFLFILTTFVGCKKNAEISNAAKFKISNSIQYAKGLEIYKYSGFSVLKVKNPWPKANKDYSYILQEKNGIIPDSLKQNTIIQIPVKTIVVTSTTHIPSLEMLGVENTLIGFPNLNYISSPKVRARIDSGNVEELGNNQSLNIEVAINLAPSIIVGYGIDNNNSSLDNLQKSGLKVVLNGDWNEQSSLGKAEWIKFFGALYGQEQKALSIFEKIVKDYKSTLTLAEKASSNPTVLSGAMFQDVWYMPQGESWGSVFLKDAKSNYLWKDTKGTGSLSLSFETVLEKGQNADFWIQGQFSTLDEIEKTNKHYTQFKAFKTKNVYSFGNKKGKTGGNLFYELAPNRPDLVLKDILKMVHPELLPNYEMSFIEKLK